MKCMRRAPMFLVALALAVVLVIALDRSQRPDASARSSNPDPAATAAVSARAPVARPVVPTASVAHDPLFDLGAPFPADASLTPDQIRAILRLLDAAVPTDAADASSPLSGEQCRGPDRTGGCSYLPPSWCVDAMVNETGALGAIDRVVKLRRGERVDASQGSSENTSYRAAILGWQVYQAFNIRTDQALLWLAIRMPDRAPVWSLLALLRTPPDRWTIGGALVDSPKPSNWAVFEQRPGIRDVEPFWENFSPGVNRCPGGLALAFGGNPPIHE